MKKVFLLAMLFATTVCNAQVVLWDGTDKEVGSDGGFWNRADPTVVEEDGNKIMKFTLKANPGGWNDEHHNAALPVGDVDFKALRRLTMRLKMTDAHNVLVQLEGKDGAYNAERIAWYDGGDGWQVMVYEFAAGPEETAGLLLFRQSGRRLGHDCPNYLRRCLYQRYHHAHCQQQHSFRRRGLFRHGQLPLGTQFPRLQP